MSKFTTEEIRNNFINYFVKNDHTHVPASSLIPHNDPSLMFVNSGMVQFKNVFTGNETKEYTRAVSSQKSVRAGGKHNDLDNVGYTARHHTFFEMLGNFSFGDYFKEEAIFYSWDLLTKEFGLPKERLYVTVYHTDDEAVKLWQKVAGLKDERIIRISDNSNFWSMGDVGPCGPCSEVFYDHGSHIPGGLPGTPEEDGDRYIEIWNMVFMQFEQVDKATRIALPKKSIDTGMGLERITAVMQGVHDNYDIDLFKSLISESESILKVKAEGEAKFSYRVIADHLRSCSFLIADGVMPSNEGRGYVLRRIMRRAMRHAHILGAKEPLMYRLLPKLVDLMGAAYPELKRAEGFVSDILKQEEIRFKETLGRGLKLLDEEISSLKGTKLPGDIAFKLYDTYGFPLDLTEDILRKKDILVDQEGFNTKMQEQKDRARKSWAGSGDSKEAKIWFEIRGEFGATEFLGYTIDTLEGNVQALVKDGAKCSSIENANEQFILISNQTPFYAESGGQMGDIGFIESHNAKVKVINTVKYLGALHAHICTLESGVVKVGDNMRFKIDLHYRKTLKSHHSATHILHAVLRNMLGDHVTQKGSLVSADRLRFDFSHPKSLSQEQIYEIEDTVNNIITDNSKVNTTLMSTEEAIEAGAMALFGEKYDNEVRVVSMGHFNDNGRSYSFELCGGTHVARTGDIGAFKITSESAIAAGVRRIEAVCGEFALKLARENDNLIMQVADILKANKYEIINKVNSLALNKKEQEKEIAHLKGAMLEMSNEQIEKEAIQLNTVKLIYKLLHDFDPKVMRSTAETQVKKVGDLVIVYINKADEKLSIVVAVSAGASKAVHAGNIAKELSLFLGGSGGGGQATLAQAGGSDLLKLPKVIDKLKELIG